MGKIKKHETSTKDRSEVEKKRRAELNKLLDKCKLQNPFVNCSDNTDKITKNIALRLISTFFEVVVSKKYINFLENAPPATEECLKYFNLKRSAFEKCSYFLCNGATKILFTHDDVFSEFGYENKDIIGYDLNKSLVPKDEREQFDENLNQAKKKLLSAVNQNKGRTQFVRQPFSFLCRLIHQQRGKAVTQNRSTVVFSGSMRLCEGTIHHRFLKQKNGHMLIKEVDSATISPTLDKQIEIIGQISRLKPDDIFRHSILAIYEKVYVLFMTPSGVIRSVDHRITRVIGHLPFEVINRPADNFIAEIDKRLALGKKIILLQDPAGESETVLRLVDCSDALVYLRTFGVLYNENGVKVFKLTAVKIECSESEGAVLIERELQKLPQELRSCTLDELETRCEQALSKYENESINVDNSNPNDLPSEQMKDAHLTSSSASLSDSEFEASTENSFPPPPPPPPPPAAPASPPPPPPPTTTTTTTLNQSVTMRPPQTFTSETNHQNIQSNDDSLLVINQSNNQNITQIAPMSLANSLIYRCIPWTSVISTDQTKFIPNQYHQVLNLPSPVPSTPQLIQTTTTLNNDNVFIHNINININNNNNNFIMYNNNYNTTTPNTNYNNNQQLQHQQHLHVYGDYQHLPTEEAFVNLIPFLENDTTSTDLNYTNTK